MKPADQDAGERRRFLKAGVAWLAAMGTRGVSAADPRPAPPLQRLFSISGARVANRMDVAGGIRLDAIGGYVPLVFPVAVAAAFGDIFIADAGTSRLYRYDRSLGVMVVLPETRISQGTRLQTGADGSIYVLDTFSSEIRRYTRGGQQLPALAPRQITSRYSDFVVDALTGRVYAVDSAHISIDEIQPLGQFSIELQRLEEAGPVASDGRGLYIAGSRCGCVVEWIHGRMGRRFGAGKLRQARSLAVVGPQIYAIDGFDRSIALVHEEGVDLIPPAALGLSMPETLASADGGTVWVADGTGQRIAAFRPARQRTR